MLFNLLIPPLKVLFSLSYVFLQLNDLQFLVFQVFLFLAQAS